MNKDEGSGRSKVLRCQSSREIDRLRRIGMKEKVSFQLLMKLRRRWWYIWEYENWSSDSSVTKVLCKAVALALYTITDTLWNKKDVSLGSPETTFIISPISHEKSVPSSLIGPRVSVATGTISWVALIAAYLVCLRSASRSAAALGVTDVRIWWETANVSGHVISQVRGTYQLSREPMSYHLASCYQIWKNQLVPSMSKNSFRKLLKTFLFDRWPLLLHICIIY